MTGFFGNPRTQTDYDFAERTGTTIGETFDTAFDVATDTNSFAIRDALKDEYQTLIEETEKQTGERIANPFSEGGFGRREFGARRARGEDVSKTTTLDVGIELFHKRFAELQRDFPALPLRSHDDMVAKVQQDRAAVRQRNAKAKAGESGLLSGAANLAGALAGGMLDPINLVTLPLGAPWSAGIIRVAATEAAIGLGTEAVAQTTYQGSRELIGEDPNIEEGLINTAIGGAAAGTLGLVGSGIARGVRALAQRRANLTAAEAIPPEARSLDLEAAIAVERRTLEIDEANPYGPDITGTALHNRRMAEAAAAIERGEPVPPPTIPEAARLSPEDLARLNAIEERSFTEPEAFGNIVKADREFLLRLGINTAVLAPEQSAARIRFRLEAETRPTPSPTQSAEPRKAAAEATTAAENEVELDATREQTVREAYAGREDEKIMIEDADGTVKPMSVHEIFEADKREASELTELSLCLRGGTN